MRWSLDELYTSFESKEYQLDLKNFNEQMEGFVKWAEENLIAYPRLLSSVEAKNEMALKYLDKLQVKYSEITKPYVRFEKFIGKLDNLDKVINSSEFLKEHSFYLNEIKKNSQYLLSEKEKILISKIKNTGLKLGQNCKIY